jgi:hypothetical protein
LSGDPQEVSWLTGGGPEVDVHGGSAMGSTAVQWWLKAEEEEGAPQGGGGVAPFYSRPEDAVGKQRRKWQPGTVKPGAR